jgi:hypothetical protein
MSFFVQPTAPTKPKTADIRTISLTLVAFFVILAVTQLFKFESFPEVIEGFWLPGGETTAKLVAALLVTGEVLALPFLLSMRLSPAMRFCSMVFGWLVIGGWLFLALWANLTTNVIGSMAIFGDLLAVPVGWWAVFLFVALGVLAGWASWGMWPKLLTRTK